MEMLCTQFWMMKGTGWGARGAFESDAAYIGRLRNELLNIVGLKHLVSSQPGQGGLLCVTSHVQSMELSPLQTLLHLIITRGLQGTVILCFTGA